MIYLILFCVPLFLTHGLQIGQTRSYLGKERRLQEGNTTENATQFMLKTLNDTQTFTSGYLRTDTFDWLRDTWIQAQVLPIGICFKEGQKGGTAKLAQITMSDEAVLQVTNIYDSSDCTGDFTSVPYLQPLEETRNQLEVQVSHVQDFEDAMELDPPSANGLIFT